MALLLAYSRQFFFSDWIPHDEGLLGQSAERVLRGQLPHLDFEEMYSGGLSFVHSWIFRSFGIGIRQLREFHWCVASVFSIACGGVGFRLFRSWWAALGVASLCTLLGPLNYPASMPSWYVLYLAVFSCSLLASAEDGTHPRLKSFLAGLLAGFSPWIKVTGVFALAGLGQVLLAGRIARTSARTVRGALFATLLFVASCLPFVVVGAKLSIELMVLLCAPIVMIGGVLARSAWSGIQLYRERVQLVPFLLGAAAGGGLPLSAALMWIGKGPLAAGLFVLPRVRLDYAFLALPSWDAFILPALAAAALVAAGVWLVRQRAIFFLLILPILAMVALLDDGYRSIWLVLRCLPLALALAAARAELPSFGKFVLWATLAAWISLTQFPYSHGIYLVYCLPLFLLAALAWLSSVNDRPVRHFAVGLGAAVGIFAIGWVNVGSWRRFGVEYRPRNFGVLLADSRIGIRVPEHDFETIPAFLEAARQSVPEGQSLIAFPDAPEVSYLVGRSSPSRGFYEFFGTGGPDASYLDRFDFATTPAIVINLQPEFSRPVSQVEFDELKKRFPNVRRFGKYLLMTREVEIHT